MSQPKVKPIPAGYHNVTPYISVADAPGLIAMIEQIFGGKQTERHDGPNGNIMHAEVKLGDSIIMISEACDQMGPQPASLYVYVDDVDATYRRLVEAGATSVMAPMDMFWGDRFASAKDTWGNTWNLATHIEDVTPEELDRRANDFAEQMAGGNP